jgi:hypothetical protein
LSYIFDGPSKRIILDSTDPVAVVELFSRWKDWVLSGNAQYAPAFRSVAGDPIGPGQVIAPYVFLNTVDGWRIRPAEVSHELRISGNLYSEDPSLSMFVPPLGVFTVTQVIERSASAIGMSVTGGGGGTAPTSEQISDAVWRQTLDVHEIPGSAGALLREIGELMALDPAHPLVVTLTQRIANGITQNITTAPDGTVSLTRLVER